MTEEERRRVNHALWSGAFHAAGLSPSVVPKELRPDSLRDALATILSLNVPNAFLVAMLVSLLRATTLVFPAPWISLPALVQRLTLSPLSPARSDIVLGKLLLDALVSAGFSMTIDLLVGLFGRLRPPCTWPTVDAPAVAAHFGASKQVELKGKYYCSRPIALVKELVDPRAWSTAGAVFEKAVPVDDKRKLEYVPKALSAKPGKSWNDLLHEVARYGSHSTESILRIDFTSSHDEAVVKYSLYDSCSMRIGGFDLPGSMRKNSGTLTARLRKQKNDPKDPSLHDWPVEITITKTLHYARVGGWGAAGVFDYGEMLNYLAPAIMTRWVDDLALVVPCKP